MTKEKKNQQVQTGVYKLVLFSDTALALPASGEAHRKTAADWVLLPNRADQCYLLRSRGVRMGIVSNQGGIAHGYYQEQDIQRELQKLQVSLDIHALEFCPMHPTGTVHGYSNDSFFRMPNPGMLLKMMVALTASPQETLFVGNREEDEAAAENACCAFAYSSEYFRY